MWSSEAAQRLGTVIRARRKALGRTQAMLAQRVGIATNHLQLIEVGRSASVRVASEPSNPRLTTLIGIASAFDLSVAELMNEADI